ncbi:NADH-quinone oxidoreductase subunit K [uncultured Amnibacterium sp.]|uniref:NADH-quinone oxidoreductase subunit K n=1 Tax=uncultured Amnibacterium sp. TaxID=1631851 RepID=UPI0035CC7E21
MSVSVALLGAMAVLYACGVYLLLEKSVTRIIIGILLIGNATNLLLLSLSGVPGGPPIVPTGTAATSLRDASEPAGVGPGSLGPPSDPLPQALILTAIVITFAVSAFLMALVYRSWRLAQEDRVERDEADVAVRAGEQPEPEAASADEESEFDRPGGDA